MEYYSAFKKQMNTWINLKNITMNESTVRRIYGFEKIMKMWGAPSYSELPGD